MKYSLTKSVLQSTWREKGIIQNESTSYFKAFVGEFLSSGLFETNFSGPTSDSYFKKLGDLLTRLPDRFEGQLVIFRKKNCSGQGFFTRLFLFEKVQKAESYSHIEALGRELGLNISPLARESWQELVSGYLGEEKDLNFPDLVWNKDHIESKNRVIRAMSLTELPQMTWRSCFQSVFEYPNEFIASLKFSVPDRKKIKRQLETKRRVSHALSITSSLEIRNIESNSILHSSEETLERILVNKETLFEMSLAFILLGTKEETLCLCGELEKGMTGIANAGLYSETLGSLPVLSSHFPGAKMLPIRKLPILSENLADILPLMMDFSRSNDSSPLRLQSRNGEISHLNQFSKANLNFNFFVCGASGSGKSFLMNAIISSMIDEDPKTRVCIFDVGGSYKRTIEHHDGKAATLTTANAHSLLASYLRLYPAQASNACTLIETLCGSGPHITHSHRVAIEELLKEINGKAIQIGDLVSLARKRPERFYQDVAHWLGPHTHLDDISPNSDLEDILTAQVSSFDFKELDSDPILQRASILLLSDLLWRDLLNATYSRTLVVFDEVWRFFAQSKAFLEEMYRTLRKYKAGIATVTQNLADYGDEAFAKMVFTNSFTKIFLQNGATAEFLRNTFDLSETDISRALSVMSKKPQYSEFFGLSPTMSQIFRLYPTEAFYQLANTENIQKET